MKAIILLGLAGYEMIIIKLGAMRHVVYLSLQNSARSCKIIVISTSTSNDSLCYVMIRNSNYL